MINVQNQLFQHQVPQSENCTSFQTVLVCPTLFRHLPAGALFLHMMGFFIEHKTQQNQLTNK